MALESGTFLGDLVSSNPPGWDSESQGDDHLRLIKAVLQGTFPNASRAYYLSEVPAAKTGAYPVVAADENKLIRGDVSGGTFAITLPVGSSIFAGWSVTIIKSDSSATVLTVDGNGAETINGVANHTLDLQFASRTYQWDGTEWKVTRQANVVVVGSGAGQVPLYSQVDLQGKRTIPMPAKAFATRTTNGSTLATAETTTNKIMVESQDFADTPNQYAQIMFPIPKSWDEGTLTFTFIWSSTAASGNAVWAAQAVAISNDDPLDAAFGTAQEVIDGVTAANDLLRSAETAAVTVAGTPAESDFLVVQVYRNTGSGSDTLVGDARLLAVEMHLTTDAGNDV